MPTINITHNMHQYLRAETLLLIMSSTSVLLGIIESKTRRCTSGNATHLNYWHSKKSKKTWKDFTSL